MTEMRKPEDGRFTGELLHAAGTKPWLRFYGDVPHSLVYPEVTLYERLMQTVEKHPDSIAWEFAVGGMASTYRELARDIDRLADALAAQGFATGDVLTISMPTSPQGVIPVYAANKLGGIASMIHPLSPPPQIEMYLNLSRSRWALTLDAFYPQFAAVLRNTSVEKLVLSKMGDFLPPLWRLLFWAARGRKIERVPPDDRVLWLSELMKGSHPRAPAAAAGPDDTAVILYSGGTTGTPKGIELTNRNLIAEGMQVSAWGQLGPGASILAILPIFHGFGLGVCVNAAFMAGGKTILIPQFTPASVAKLVAKKRPNFLIGVPTLFEALARDPAFRNAPLSCLTATFSGADTLPRKTKELFEGVVREAGGTVKLLEGYGLTEAVTAMMGTPMNDYREGSVGIPMPDMLVEICKEGTAEEAPCGDIGEICVSGPDVMKGYLGNPEATAQALRRHADGRIWLHTGDLGRMDKDGWVYFALRLKRMLKVSGVNVYPTHVEEVMRKHPDVEDVCVIGVPDPLQMTRVKAFVVLDSSVQPHGGTAEALRSWCLEHLLKWESPREIELRSELPKTLIGKIDFHKLELEEEAAQSAAPTP